MGNAAVTRPGGEKACDSRAFLRLLCRYLPTEGIAQRGPIGRNLLWLEPSMKRTPHIAIRRGRTAMTDERKPTGPDLTKGVVLKDFVDGKLLGHVGDDPVLLVQLGADVVAIDALCSHYHGPLAEGLIVDDTVRCPWHHACFSLRTGEAVRAPAFSA